MRFSSLIFIISITCTFPVNAQVIDYEIDSSFNSGDFYNRGKINDLLLINDSTTLVTGYFSNPLTMAGGYSVVGQNGSVIFNQPLSSLGPTKVTKFLTKYLAYGAEIIQLFDFENGTDFSFRFEFQKQAYTGPLSNVALDAMVMPDDNILVAGRFFTDSTLMGTDQSHLGLRQLCMIDSTGAPVEGFPMLRCEWPTNAVIYTIDTLSTGEFIIAGSFNEVDGHPYAKLTKLNADFSVDADFEPVFSQGSGEVFTTLIDSQDRIWVIFGPNVGIIDDPDYPGRLLRLLPDGTIDESFNAPIFTTYAGGTYENPVTPSQIAAGVTEDEDGTFIVSGDFIEINGEAHRRLAKIDDTGQVIEGAFESTSPDSSVWGSWVGSFGPVMSAGIRVVKKLPDGKLLLGGQFSSFGGEPYSCLVRLQPSGFVGVEDRAGRGKLKLWPNPALDYVQVSLPDVNERIERVDIYDLQGRVVSQVSLQDVSGGKINIQQLMPGIYLLSATSAKGVCTQKLVVQ
jgi:hypothetical protein